MNPVSCPSCGIGNVLATFQVLATYGPAHTDTVSAPDPDSFVHAECTNDECHDALAQDPGDGRIRRAGLQRLHTAVPGDAYDPDAWVNDPALENAWVLAVFAVIGHEHPEQAVTFNDDGTMTCGVCGQTAPADTDTLTLTED